MLLFSRIWSDKPKQAHSHDLIILSQYGTPVKDKPDLWLLLWFSEVMHVCLTRFNVKDLTHSSVQYHNVNGFHQFFCFLIKCYCECWDRLPVSISAPKFWYLTWANRSKVKITILTWCFFTLTHFLDLVLSSSTLVFKQTLDLLQYISLNLQHDKTLWMSVKLEKRSDTLQRGCPSVQVLSNHSFFLHSTWWNQIRVK